MERPRLRLPSTMLDESLLDGNGNGGRGLSNGKPGGGLQGRSGTPRTPNASPRTPKDRGGVASEGAGEGDKRRRQKEQRQKELLVSEILSGMDTSQISRMKDEFDKRPGRAVSLVEFVQIFRDALFSGQSQEDLCLAAQGEAESSQADASTTLLYPLERMRSRKSAARLNASPTFWSLVDKLRTLFEEIDINGDCMMEWDEFTNYIISNGGGSAGPGVGSSGAAQGRSVGYKAGPDATSAVQHYEETELGHDIMLNKLEKLRYVPQLDRLVVCDKNPVVRVYKLTSQKFHDDLELVKELKGVHTRPILNAEYVHGLLCTSGADSTVALWDTVAGFRHKASIRARQQQFALLAHPSREDVLISAGAGGTIYGWNLYSRASSGTGTTSEMFQFLGHNDTVNDLKVLSTSGNSLASASMDSRVYIWDLTTGDITTQVKGHTKAVSSLAYSTKHKLLFSGSFDRDIIAWNPVVDDVVFTLRGHHTGILGMEIIEDSSYVISADHDGVFKLWDIRTCDCLQTFTANTPTTNQGLCSFTVLPQKKKIVAGGRKIYTFDYHKPGVPWLTDDRAITAVLFNSKSLTMLTASGKDVKIWDVSTGLVVASFPQITREDITAACLDVRQRKMVLGSSDGSINVFNYANGTHLRTLTPHKLEITSLYAVDKNTYLSCSADAHIFLHDESVSQKKPTAVKSYIAPPTFMEGVGVGRDVTCLCLSRELSLVVSATISNLVRVWDLEDTSLDSQFKQHAVEVTCVSILAPFPVAASSDCQGWVCLYALRPHQMRNHCICRWQNLLPNSTPCGVFSLAFVPETRTLFTGNYAGDIKVWPLAALFDACAIKSVVLTENGDTTSSTTTTRISKSKRKSISFSTADAANRDGSSAVSSEGLTEKVKLVRQWSAHTESVHRIVVVRTGPNIVSLVTCSADKRVRAWSTEGEYHGTLRQSPEGGNWALPIDSESREKENSRQVEAIIAKLSEHDQDVEQELQRMEANQATALAFSGTSTSAAAQQGAPS